MTGISVFSQISNVRNAISFTVNERMFKICSIIYRLILINNGARRTTIICFWQSPVPWTIRWAIFHHDSINLFTHSSISFSRVLISSRSFSKARTGISVTFVVSMNLFDFLRARWGERFGRLNGFFHFFLRALSSKI